MKNIKMIAVDMDGTFLDDSMGYDKNRFMKQYHVMKERGIRFVVASGNQYYQLRSFFPEIMNDISFVAENGAYVVDQGEPLYNAAMDVKLVNDVLDVLSHYSNIHYVVCGVGSAYIHESVDQGMYDQINKYYHRLKKVPTLYGIEDTIFKFALLVPKEDLAAFNKELNERLGHHITAVTSGQIAIDLIVPGIHKASGLKRLQEVYDIEAHEIAAFGDSGNDLEMLEHAHFSFAMENGKMGVKDVAKSIIASNNDNAVLDTIDLILNS